VAPPSVPVTTTASVIPPICATGRRASWMLDARVPDTSGTDAVSGALPSHHSTDLLPWRPGAKLGGGHAPHTCDVSRHIVNHPLTHAAATPPAEAVGSGITSTATSATNAQVAVGDKRVSGNRPAQGLQHHRGGVVEDKGATGWEWRQQVDGHTRGDNVGRYLGPGCESDQPVDAPHAHRG